MLGDFLGNIATAGIGGIVGAIKKRRKKKKEKKAKIAAVARHRRLTRKAIREGTPLPPPLDDVSLPDGSSTIPSSTDSESGLNPTGSTEAGFQQSPNKYSPEQQQILNYLLAQGKSRLENPNVGFEPIEEEARSKFQSESLPSIAERFSALGGSDTSGSSDLIGMLGGAQSEFDQGIASLKAQYGLQNQDRALNLLQLGLTPQSELAYFQGQPPLPGVPSTGSRLFEAGAGALGNYFAGGGDFGIGGALGRMREKRAQKQEKQSLASKILNKGRLSTLAGGGKLSSNPSSSKINAFANAIALKRLQGGK